MSCLYSVIRSSISRKILLTCSSTTCHGIRNLSADKDSKRRYIPRRAVLYVPGNDDRKLRKIPKLTADCIVMDCEDGVALSKKEEARLTIHKVLHNQEIDFSGKDCSVRFNGVESGLCEADIEGILTAAHLPDTLHLPKVENPECIKWFADKLKPTLSNRILDEKLRLIIFIESAQALLGLPAICQQAIDTSIDSKFVLDGIVFGSDDFCADIGATRTNEASELFFARQYVVAVAKAFRLQAIDLVYIDYKDLEGLRIQSEEGARFGFTGKQVIHPGQVPVVQNAFSPTAEKVKWAKELISAFEEHQKQGKGAFTFRGNMIDMPLVLQAQNILHVSRQIDG